MSQSLLFWQCTAVVSSILLMAAIAILSDAVLRRHWHLVPPCLISLAAVYILVQSVDHTVDPDPDYPGAMAFARWVTGLPPALAVAVMLVSGVFLFLCARALILKERREITAMSIKEAADSLPSGLCYYLPGGRIVLVNRAMESLCLRLTGRRPVNGEQLRAHLFSGSGRNDGTSDSLEADTLLTLSDYTAWSVTDNETVFDGAKLHMLVATDVTELYQKNRSLEQMRRDLDVLNLRLTDYLKEIVSLSTQREMLSARVHLHDELGTDLLMMQQYLRSGGTEAERSAIEKRLRRDISFLNASPSTPDRDELELLMETALRLNFRILVEGSFPESDPHRHVLVTAVHECFTNTLRHARGDCLRISVEETDNTVTAVLTNNGTQPDGPIRETGGLRTLRVLTEQAGGRMTTSVSPELSITIELPKEEHHAVQRPDCG